MISRYQIQLIHKFPSLYKKYKTYCADNLEMYAVTSLKRKVEEAIKRRQVQSIIWESLRQLRIQVHIEVNVNYY